MKTIEYYVVSSTRMSGIWGEEKLELGSGSDFDLAHGFDSFEAAFKFLQKEADKLSNEPDFYRAIVWNRTNEGHEPPEYKLTYEYLSATDNKWYPVKLKFRIWKKSFNVLDEDEALSAKFF